MPCVLKCIIINEIINLNNQVLRIFDDYYEIGLQVFLYKGLRQFLSENEKYGTLFKEYFEFLTDYKKSVGKERWDRGDSMSSIIEDFEEQSLQKFKQLYESSTHQSEIFYFEDIYKLVREIIF